MNKITLRDGGEILLIPDFIKNEKHMETLLRDVKWQQQKALYGYMQPRLTAAYGNDGLNYKYSNTENPGETWIPVLMEIKNAIEKIQGSYNYCLLNRYRTGSDSIAFHADDEPEVADTIASVSLGDSRIFRIRHNETKEITDFNLENGTLLIMSGTMQKFYQHRVPKTAKAVGERINLTYRNISEMPKYSSHTYSRPKSII
jgi:alkylated DNA repair dioxygenase AlkB